MRAARVAALADVHGNALALEAVLREVEESDVDLVVSCGDVTWGSQPRETLSLVARIRDRARFVRGNAERALAEIAVGADASERARWLLERHDDDARAFLGAFEESVLVEIDGLGRTLFCHGSPRSDEELITERTPESRVRDLLAGVDADVVVTAHTHVRFDRVVDGVRLLNPGSVGLPYEGERGAYWALLGPDVTFRRTEYDVELAAELMRASGDPAAQQIVELMLEPPTRDEAIEHAESLAFSS